MLGNGDLILMTLHWPQLGTSLRRLIKSLSHRGSLRHSFLVPSLYDSSKQHLEFTRKAESVLNNWKRPKPQARLRTSPDKRGHVNPLFIWTCDRAPKVAVNLTRRCAGRPPSPSLIPVLFFTSQLKLWDFFSGQSGRTKASFSEGDGHRSSEKRYDGKSHEKFMTQSY